MQIIKKYLWIFVLVIIYIGIAFSINYISPNSNNNLIVDRNIIFHYNKGKWSLVPKENFSKIKFFNYQMYDILSNEYLGRYNLSYNDGWQIKEGLNYTDYDNDIFAYRGNSKFKVIDYNYSDILDFDNKIISTYLANNKLPSIDKLLIKNKIVLDIDNDMDVEYIYEISDMYCDEYVELYFSSIFIYDNGQYITLESSYLHDDILYEKNQSSVFKIIDIEGDKNYEIITFNMFYSRPDDGRYNLYKLKDSDYELLISSSEGEE